MPKKILIIDDEELVTVSLKKLLKKSGYEIDTANSGQEALKKIESTDFDLIVSDIRMPDLSGVDVIKKIRDYLKHKGKPSIPEILMTGHASQEHLDEAQKLKVSDYLYKPFNIHNFLDIIKRNLK